MPQEDLASHLSKYLASNKDRLPAIDDDSRLPGRICALAEGMQISRYFALACRRLEGSIADETVKPIQDIQSDAERKRILHEQSESLSGYRNALPLIAKLNSPQNQPSGTNYLTPKELVATIVLAIILAPMFGGILANQFHIHWGITTLAVTIVVCTLTYQLGPALAARKDQTLLNQLVTQWEAVHRRQISILERYTDDLVDSHNIDIIRAKEIANVHKNSAVATAVEVGNVTKTVAAETAEITRKLIDDGQKLKAENATSQVQLVDQLADKLEEQANQMCKTAAAAPADDRDARIAVLQTEIAKLEEIKVLESRLATLKGDQ